MKTVRKRKRGPGRRLPRTVSKVRLGLLEVVYGPIIREALLGPVFHG
jgi:hypothetical protein